MTYSYSILLRPLLNPLIVRIVVVSIRSSVVVVQLILQAVLDPGLPSFGFAIAVADVDGDGLSDVLVGAPEADGGRGAAALYLGGALDQPAARWSGDELADRLGFSVALGPGRILVGAPGGPGAPGKAHLIPYP